MRVVGKGFESLKAIHDVISSPVLLAGFATSLAESDSALLRGSTQLGHVGFARGLDV